MIVQTSGKKEAAGSAEWFEREALDLSIGKQILPVDTVLDIGCGLRPQTFLRAHLHICCEPNPEYVAVLQNRFSGVPGILVVQCNGEEITSIMPDDSIDTVFLIDVLEHLDKGDGHRLLEECERVARKQVVLFTPLGYMPQEYEDREPDGWGLHGGVWQRHRSGWSPDDLGPTWSIFGCQAYHLVNGKGEVLDPPFGAFWAIKNIDKGSYSGIPSKILVLSLLLPPSPSPQAVFLYHLLKDINRDDYVLVSANSYDPYDFFQNSPCRLEAAYLHLSRPGGAAGEEGENPRETGGLPAKTKRFLKHIVEVCRIARRGQCGAILACSGGLSCLALGYTVSRLLGIRLLVLVFDDYAAKERKGLRRVLVQGMVKAAFRRASAILSIDDALCEALIQRHKIRPVVICDPARGMEEFFALLKR